MMVFHHSSLYAGCSFILGAVVSSHPVDSCPKPCPQVDSLGVSEPNHLRNQKPVYHKTDAVRTASLWFAAGDWRLGPSIQDGTVWAYATSEVLSG